LGFAFPNNTGEMQVVPPEAEKSKRAFSGVNPQIHGDQRNNNDADAASGSFLRYAPSAPVLDISASAATSPSH
jgi:hypothetical protein